MGAGNYNLSTRGRIADIVLGLHVQTTDGILTATHFTNGTTSTLFNLYGRIALMDLFIELTAAADANASTVKFRAEFTTPVIAVADICGASGSIANLAAYRRIVWVGGAVVTAAIITASAGITDVDPAAKRHILGGISAAGANTVGLIAMTTAGATQAATITATGHLFYVPMSPGAYVTAAL